VNLLVGRFFVKAFWRSHDKVGSYRRVFPIRKMTGDRLYEHGQFTWGQQCRINWWFWECGPNLSDTPLYLNYLLQ
jgi:hypothetical protein